LGRTSVRPLHGAPQLAVARCDAAGAAIGEGRAWFRVHARCAAQGGDSVSFSVYGTMHALTGVRIGGKGVFTNARGHAYRGQAIDGKADGLGVLTYPDGRTWSGGWSAGVRHGHTVYHCTDGDVRYVLCDRGTVVLFALVRAGGACLYDYHNCAADDARLLALTAAALDAAVRRTALAGRFRSPCCTELSPRAAAL
jgi:hypothetical protein